MRRIATLLRYNTRHSLYYHPSYTERGGVRIVLGWSLNPIGSRYDGKQKTLDEPLWLFRLRQRLFAFAGRHRCGRRGGMPDFDGRGSLPEPDTWDLGPDGNRTCSYCGSIHPDDLIAICRKVPTDKRYAIEGTTKSYKVYVRQPGVQNASQGAIKFYMHHAPAAPSEEDQRLFAEAVRISNERHNEMMAAWRAERQARA
jgi:hypothetical protein